MKNTIIKNGTIITPFRIVHNRVLFLQDGKIKKIVHQEEFCRLARNAIADFNVIDAEGLYVAPGFIDIHAHGACGVDAVSDSVGPMADFKVRHGTTGFLPTIWCSGFDRMVEACKRISLFIEGNNTGSIALGINSEGPYLNSVHGAQMAKYVRVPEYEDYSRLMEACCGNLKIMTVAPELESAAELIEFLRENDVHIGNIKVGDVDYVHLWTNSGGISLDGENSDRELDR